MSSSSQLPISPPGTPSRTPCPPELPQKQIHQKVTFLKATIDRSNRWRAVRTVRPQVVVEVGENNCVDDVGRAARLSCGINNVDDGGDVSVGRGSGRGGGGEERMGAGLGPDPVDVATPIPAQTKSHRPQPPTTAAAGLAPLASVDDDHPPRTPARNIADDHRPARSIPPPSEGESFPPGWLDEVLNAGQRAVGAGDDQLVVDGDDDDVDVDASDKERNLPFAASSSISANREPESWQFKLGDSTRFGDDDDEVDRDGGGDHEERYDGDDDDTVMNYTDDEDRDVVLETQRPGLGSTVLGKESQEQLDKLTVFFQQGDADSDRKDEHEAAPSLYENNISSTSTEQPSTDRFRTISAEPAPTRPEYEHTPLDNVARTGSSERIAGSHASEGELPRETPEMEANESDTERSSPWPKTPIKEESQQSTTDELLEEINDDESQRSTPWPNTPIKEESQASTPISVEAPEDASSDCEVQLCSPWPNTPIKEESQASLPISQELPHESSVESSEDEFLSGPPWPKTPVKQEASQTAILQSTLEDESTRWCAHTPIKAEACESQINISLQLIDSFPAPSATASTSHTISPTPDTPPRTARTARKQRFIPRQISDPEDQPPPRRRRLHRRASAEISSPTTPTATSRPSQAGSSPYLAPATQLQPKPRVPTPPPALYHDSSSDINMVTPPPPSRRRRRILRSSIATATPSYTDRLLSTYNFRPTFPTPAYALLECLTPSELHYELLRLNKYWTLHADDSEIPPTDLEFPDETYDLLWRAAQDLAGLWCASVLEREMPVDDITREEFSRLEDEKRVFGRWRDKMMVVLGKELRLSTNNWGIRVLGLRKDRKMKVGVQE